MTARGKKLKVRRGRRAPSAASTRKKKIGRPRVSDEPMKSMSLYVPAEIHERMRREAFRRDVSVNYLARRMLTFALPEWENDDLP